MQAVALAQTWSKVTPKGKYSAFDVLKSLVKGNPFKDAKGVKWTGAALEAKHEKYVRSMADGMWPASVTKNNGRGNLADMFCSKFVAAVWAAVLGSRERGESIPLDPSHVYPGQLNDLPRYTRDWQYVVDLQGWWVLHDPSPKLGKIANNVVQSFANREDTLPLPALESQPSTE